VNKTLKVLVMILALCPLVVFGSASPLIPFSPRETVIVAYAATTSNATQPTTLQRVTMNLNSYAPAKVFISYAYTSSFNISKVSSVGLSLYQIISGPTSIQFQATDVDSYHFSVVINYNVLVEQTIQVSTWSGDLPPQGTSFSVKANTISFDFTLTVTKQPSYPTVDQVATAVVNQLSNSLQQFQVAQQNLVSEISNTVMAIGTIAVVALVLVVVLLLAVLKIYRKQASLEQGIGGGR